MDTLATKRLATNTRRCHAGGVRAAPARASGLAALTVLTAALAACSTTDPTPLVVQCSPAPAAARGGPALVGQTYGMQMTPLPLNSVQYGSAALSRSMALQSLHAQRTGTDNVHVSARVVSCLDQALQVRMRTSFMRTDTAPTEAPSAWKTVWLQPRATAVYTEQSTASDAAQYLIEIAP